MFSIKESSTKVDSWVQSFKGAGLFDCLVGIDEVGVVGAKRFILAFGKAAPKWEVEEEADDDLDDEAELNSIDELDEEAEGDLEKEVDAAAKPEEEADGVAKAEPEEEADAVAEVEPEEAADFDVDWDENIGYVRWLSKDWKLIKELTKYSVKSIEQKQRQKLNLNK